MTAPIFDFPTPAELREIEQITLPKMEAERNSPWLENFPDEPHEDTIIMWEQMGNFLGLMQFRGYGNKSPRVNQIQARSFVTQPGVYGEKQVLSEDVLTRRRLLGSFGNKMSISDLVALAQRQLLERRLNLKEYIVSQFVTTGAYSVPDGSGVNWTGDGFTPQTYSASTAWSDHANSTPLYDLMQIALVPFGQSVNTSSQAELVINTPTFNNLVLNRNTADFFGLRNNFGGTIPNSLTKINEMFVAYNLPRIRVYDGYYLAGDSQSSFLGTATRFTLNNKAVLFARRDSGAKPGGFAITYNATAGAATPYTKVVYHNDVPEQIEVHDGFNGGPIIRYPGTIVVATGL